MFRRESLIKHEMFGEREIIIEQESVSDNHSSERGKEQDDGVEE
jgi:hypothetical protein